MGQVRTLGRASIPARPDRARVFVDIVHVAASPAAALAEVTERVAALDALLRTLGLLPAEWSTSGVSVAEHHEPDERRFEPPRYRAADRTVVRLADVTLIGRLLSEATVEARGHVVGPFWEVDPDNPARIEALRLAALDARRRADTYAGALGCTLGAVELVRELGTHESHGVETFMPSMHMMSAKSAAPIDIAPGEVDVSAEVEVTFMLA